MNILSKIIKSSLLLALLVFCSDMQAQKQTLTPELIFKLRQANNPAEIVKWIDNKSFLVVKRDDKTSYFRVTVKGKTTVETEIDEQEYRQYFPKNRMEVNNGDIFFDNKLIVGGNNRNPELSPDEKYIAHTRNNDLYVTRLADKKEFRLTSDGSNDIMNGYASWVYMEEILGRHTHYRAFWWSPDSKNIAFFRTDDSRVPLFSITDSPGQHGYLETIRYPKVGDPNPEVKIGIIDCEGSRPPVWADFDPKQDQYFGKPYWTPSGKNLWVQWSNREQNTLKIFEVDTALGSKKEIYVETQDTWIDIDRSNTVNFLSDGNVIIVSDRSKHTHLYLHAADGKLINPVTQGDFSVLDIVKIDEKNKTVYFTCFKDNIACRDFYKASFDGKKLQRLSFGDYTHDVRLSPAAEYFVSTFSNVKTPVKSSLYSTDGKLVTPLYDARNEENEKYEWATTELVTVTSDDGRYKLPMRVTYPPKFDKSKKYPVLVSVYGGPGAITVNEGWTGNSTMQHLYACEGLIQVAMDHRGSRHFGKRGQDEMYRNLGKVEIMDYSTCVKWLLENAQADPERICINGFSYGGYITCYALLTAPDLFTHGIAGGSVTDWTLYDAPYTERFMAQPKNNPEGYRQSSALVHANKLKGKLLLTHGLIDENVHIQNTFQLVSALEENKKYFDLVIYPSARHGYGGVKGEHFRNLQIKFIYEHLLKKNLPENNF
ncbi:MAG: S9 family peptidase [Prevotellaceae bacterium]|jgi:dipeptidyl-peptidase-4|nr:S9 family peptidase [Prevotellaceae bacterium]